MDDPVNIAINFFGYMAGIWIAFKIFDFKKKGRERDKKDDRLLWPLLLIFGLGAGTLFVHLIKSWLQID